MSKWTPSWRDIDEALKPRTSPWGRPLEPESPTPKDFTEVGLSEADAKAAFEGLMSGKFMSFEDACLSTAIFGPSKSVQLDESAMRLKARRFAAVRG